jgi:glycogen debranching enzyme
LASSEEAYNPNGYHTGSVWPHDNAIYAVGLARYGFKEEAGLILQGMYEAFCYTGEIPELIQGLPREPGKGPEPYHEAEQTHIMANKPQAWAAAAPIGILQALLGLEYDAAHNCIRLNEPYLPEFLKEGSHEANVCLRDLKLNGQCVDIELMGSGYDVRVEVLNNPGGIKIEHRKKPEPDEVGLGPLAGVLKLHRPEVDRSLIYSGI